MVLLALLLVDTGLTGWYISQDCQKKETPTVLSSSWGHGNFLHFQVSKEDHQISSTPLYIHSTMNQRALFCTRSERHEKSFSFIDHEQHKSPQTTGIVDKETTNPHKHHLLDAREILLVPIEKPCHQHREYTSCNKIAQVREYKSKSFRTQVKECAATITMIMRTTYPPPS